MAESGVGLGEVRAQVRVRVGLDPESQHRLASDLSQEGQALPAVMGMRIRLTRAKDPDGLARAESN